MDTVASEAGGSNTPLPSGAARPRLTAWVAAFALAAAVARAAAGILEAPAHTFAETRLMPLFVAAAGGPAYADPGRAPFYLPMYPPLSFLAYAPVLLAKTPVPALRIGAAACEVFALLSAVLVLFGGAAGMSRALAWAAVGGLACWLHVSPVLTALFFVHADAPAVLLAGAGVAFLLHGLGRGGRGSLALSLVLLSLAPWAKQTFLPVVLLPAVVLWASDRRRAVGCLLGAAVLEALWAALFGAAFGPRALAFWTLEFPARHPWNAAPAEALAGANRLLVAESAVLVAFLGAIVATARRRAPARAILREPAVVLALAGLLLWPGSLAGYVKVGGAVNSFIPTLFFLAAAAVAALLGRAGDSPAARAALLLASALLAAQAALDAAVIARRAATAAWDADFAFGTVRHDAPHVLFPWFPLSTYLASGAFAPAEIGVDERDLAGLPPGREAWAASLPGPVRYVLCGKDPCPAVLARFRVVATRETRRGGTTWTAYEVGPPREP